MSLSMHCTSIPYFVRALNNLSVILKKGAAHAQEHDIDPTIFVAGRLFPDMFPLSRQVQIACDVSKGAAARISGIAKYLLSRDHGLQYSAPQWRGIS